MRATAILVRWQGGWKWVVPVSGTRLSIEICEGQSGDSAETIHKARAELRTYQDGQVEMTVGIDPALGDPVPGKDWTAGDQVVIDGGYDEVVALTMTLNDATGRWSAVPQFGTRLDHPDQRIDRTLKSIGGIVGGTSHLARPVAPAQPPGVRPP